MCQLAPNQILKLWTKSFNKQLQKTCNCHTHIQNYSDTIQNKKYIV